MSNSDKVGIQLCVRIACACRITAHFLRRALMDPGLALSHYVADTERLTPPSPLVPATTKTYKLWGLNPGLRA